MVRAAVIALCIAGGCVDPDYSMTHFVCDPDHTCPDRQVCTAGTCGGTSIDVGPYAVVLHDQPTVSLAIGGMTNLEQAPLQLSSGALSAAQSWDIEPIDGVSNGYHIVSLASNLCMDIDNRDVTNGLEMQQIRCQLATGITQIFQFLPLGTSFQIQNEFTGKCIDAGPDESTGAKALQWTCTPSYPHQSWDLVRVGSGA